ncbi:MAG: hypothetical protein F6J90_23465 [Moorea sp. SIOASIH]|uniref:hypothetical protein n=1 Tax=Moorena sp. SIOASIH TaxID=2607817 RepID=UPI0013B99AF5|nr:hypothetical protein [Moorena sp. SIOASIH]NEO39132.1 hypothetical protein [Moorena sp. SIOASIH]
MRVNTIDLQDASLWVQQKRYIDFGLKVYLICPHLSDKIKENIGEYMFYICYKPPTEVTCKDPEIGAIAVTYLHGKDLADRYFETSTI